MTPATTSPFWCLSGFTLWLLVAKMLWWSGVLGDQALQLAIIPRVFDSLLEFFNSMPTRIMIRVVLFGL